MSIAKNPYTFVLFQEGVHPPPGDPSGSAHELMLTGVSVLSFHYLSLSHTHIQMNWMSFLVS